MRSLAMLLLAATAALNAETAQVARERFSLSLKAERSVVETGANVRMTCLMSNNSDRTVSVQVRSAMEDYRIEVWDAQGVSVPETELGRSLQDVRKRGLIVTRNFITKIKTGATYEDAIDVSMFYEMQNTGKYRIRVQRDLPKELGEGVVKSNTISVTITP